MAWKFTSIETAEAAYEDLKKRIVQGNVNKAEAESLLKQIITDLPDTWIAGLAEGLLKEL